MKILITGDLVVSQEYKSSSIDKNVIDFFKQSDYNIVNLEAPITTNESKILKTGPYLKSDYSSTLNVLQMLHIDLVTLANNHVLDYGEKGLEDTLDFCIKNSFQTVGAGKRLDEAAKTLFLESPEGNIAVINFAENEWASATDKSAGANPMDIIDNINQIKEAKKKADLVIVIVHGGHEYYNLPSPRVRKQYRFYADQGADIVVGHHTHCISGYEDYKGVPIYYSLGNFLFTKSSPYPEWYIGLVLEVQISEGKIKTSCHPVRQEKSNFHLTLLKEQEKASIMTKINEYNSIISDSSKLEENWALFRNLKADLYLNMWSPLIFIKNRYINAIFRKLGIRFTTKKGMATHLNLMRCEAHYNMSKDIIYNYLKK